MRTFNSPGPSEFARLSTQEIRREFLIDGLFEPGRIHLAATGLDRLIVGGIVPASELVLDAVSELRAECFNERRETGVINIGAPGRVVVDGSEYVLGTRECLYIGMGARDVRFQSAGEGAPAVYYLLSCPAHRQFPTTLVTHADATIVQIGDARNASCRRMVRYIHEHGVQSCQLVMGYTELAEGNVWNTWPAHTHARRSEVYLYFDCNGLVTHLLGVPTETRHVIVRDREAVLSPPWSIHTGAGTSSYRFVWGMAGENRTFGDMDPIDDEVFA